MKCIVKAPPCERVGVVPVARKGCRTRCGREEREDIAPYSSRRGEERGISVPREGSANGVANEYRVWIREEPIGVRDVLPRSREKRQSGVLIGGIALG